MPFNHKAQFRGRKTMANERMAITTTTGGQLQLVPIVKDVITWVNQTGEDYIVGNFQPESPFLEGSQIVVPAHTRADAHVKGDAESGQYTYTCSSSQTAGRRTALSNDSVAGVVVVDTSGPPIEPKQ